MRKLVLLAHLSLDGFVAGPQGQLDGFDPGEENLQFVCELTRMADSALLGRVSYELLDAYWPGARDLTDASQGQVDFSNWYNQANKIVFSRTLSPAGLSNTRIINGEIMQEMTRLKAEIGKDILIFGSPKVSQILINLDLIDSYWIFINPKLFIAGIPLFAGLERAPKLKFQVLKEFPNGEVALHYLKAGE